MTVTNVKTVNVTSETQVSTAEWQIAVWRAKQEHCVTLCDRRKSRLYIAQTCVTSLVLHLPSRTCVEFMRTVLNVIYCKDDVTEPETYAKRNTTFWIKLYLTNLNVTFPWRWGTPSSFSSIGGVHLVLKTWPLKSKPVQFQVSVFGVYEVFYDRALSYQTLYLYDCLACFLFRLKIFENENPSDQGIPNFRPEGKPKTIFRPKHLKSNTVFWYSFLHASLQLTRSGTETLKTIDIAQVENYLTLSFPLCSAFAFAIAKTKFDFHEIP